MFLLGFTKKSDLQDETIGQRYRRMSAYTHPDKMVNKDKNNSAKRALTIIHTATNHHNKTGTLSEYDRRNLVWSYVLQDPEDSIGIGQYKFSHVLDLFEPFRRHPICASLVFLIFLSPLLSILISSLAAIAFCVTLAITIIKTPVLLLKHCNSREVNKHAGNSFETEEDKHAGNSFETEEDKHAGNSFETEEDKHAGNASETETIIKHHFRALGVLLATAFPLVPLFVLLAAFCRISKVNLILSSEPNTDKAIFQACRLTSRYHTIDNDILKVKKIIREENFETFIKENLSDITSYGEIEEYVSGLGIKSKKESSTKLGEASATQPSMQREEHNGINAI